MRKDMIIKAFITNHFTDQAETQTCWVVPSGLATADRPLVLWIMIYLQVVDAPVGHDVAALYLATWFEDAKSYKVYLESRVWMEFRLEASSSELSKL
jgi:hypothetical protein